jgi:hypothetical protein
MRLCFLSGPEVAEFERCGVKPDCAQHQHISPDEALRRVSTKTARFVGPRKRALTAISNPTDPGYANAVLERIGVLRIQRSDGFTVVQTL